MVKLSKYIFLILILSFVTSCQSESSVDEPQVNNSDNFLLLTSSMTDEDFINACFSTKEQLGSLSRATQITEFEAQNMVKPFVEDGLNLKNQIVNQLADKSYDESDILFFKDLSEEECAILSFIYHSMKDAGLDTSILSSDKEIDVAKVMSCLSLVADYEFITKISLKDLLLAKTVKKMICFIAKRYIGYLGIAIFIYNFVECIK